MSAKPDAVTALAAAQGAIVGARVRAPWVALATLLLTEAVAQAACRAYPAGFRAGPSPLAKSALDVAVGMGGYYLAGALAAPGEPGR